MYTKYEIDYNKFKSGGLHEKHVVATWNIGNHLSNVVTYFDLLPLQILGAE